MRLATFLWKPIRGKILVLSLLRRTSLETNQQIVKARFHSRGNDFWLPPDYRAGQIDLKRSSYNLMVLSPGVTKPNLLNRLKKSPVYSLYINQIKAITFARHFIIWFWKYVYPFCIRSKDFFRSRISGRQWIPLVRLRDYVVYSELPRTEIFSESKVNTPRPRVFPADLQADLVPPHDDYIFPSIYIARIRNGVVYGDTNLVIAKNAGICHDLYNFEQDYTSEELHCKHLIDVRKHKFRRYSYDSKPFAFRKAATFVDACAANYAHWLTEVLPRIATFCTVNEFANIPILINEGLHPNIMQSLMLLVGEERRVLAIPADRAALIGSLYVTSVVGYVQFERRTLNCSECSHGLFSPSAIEIVRNHFLSIVANISAEKYPKKIYLRRTSLGRRIANQSEVEEVLLEHDFAIVEPERLSFLEQVKLFSHAKVIIGPSGASFANIVFATNQVNCCILIPRIRGTSYWYWQNIACSSGKTIRYVFGEPLNKMDGIHGDFSVKLEDIIEAIGI